MGLLRRFVVAERSMSPALAPGQNLLGVRVRRPRRGQIVCIHHPDQDTWLVKRVIGLPGERVAVVDGRVVIDGTPITEWWTTDDTEPDGTWDVGPGKMFVLSDARYRSSADSRTFGPVPIPGSYRVVRAGRRARN